VQTARGGHVSQILLPPSLRVEFPHYMLPHPNRMQIAKVLSGSGMRNSIMGRIILGLFQKGRDMYVFGAIKKHLEMVSEQAVGAGVPQELMGFYFGGCKTAALKQAAAKRITFVTYSMASEGLNIPRKDTILCITPPPSNLRQLWGRINRIVEGKKEPLVIDPVDFWPGLKKKGEVRFRKWKKEKLQVSCFEWERYYGVQSKETVSF